MTPKERELLLMAGADLWLRGLPISADALRLVNEIEIEAEPKEVMPNGGLAQVATEAGPLQQLRCS